MFKEKIQAILCGMLALGLVVVAPVQADCSNDSCDCNGPCFTSCCDWNLCPNLCSDFSISAELLIWKPCFTNLDYGYTTSSTFAADTATSGRYKYVDPSWQPGFRIRMDKDNVWCNGWDFNAAYTYINASDSSGVSSSVTDGVQSTRIPPSIGINLASAPFSLRANSHLQYRNLDLLFATDYMCCPCQKLTPFFGVQWLRVDNNTQQKLTDSIAAPNTNYYAAKWTGDTWAVGWKMGSRFNYVLCDCLDLDVVASGSLLAGMHKNVLTVRELTGASSANHTNWQFKSDDCACIPSWDFSVGLSYAQCFCGMQFQFKIAYEFVQLIGMPSPASLFGVSTTNTVAQRGAPNDGTLGFHGVNLGVTATF